MASNSLSEADKIAIMQKAKMYKLQIKQQNQTKKGPFDDKQLEKSRQPKHDSSNKTKGEQLLCSLQDQLI